MCWKVSRQKTMFCICPCYHWALPAYVIEVAKALLRRRQGRMVRTSAHHSDLGGHVVTMLAAVDSVGCKYDIGFGQVPNLVTSFTQSSLNPCIRVLNMPSHSLKYTNARVHLMLCEQLTLYQQPFSCIAEKVANFFPPTLLLLLVYCAHTTRRSLIHVHKYPKYFSASRGLFPFSGKRISSFAAHIQQLTMGFTSFFRSFLLITLAIVTCSLIFKCKLV
jgi:hypothetical protein